MTSCTGSVHGGFWGFEKKVSWVEFLPLKKMVDFRGSPRPCAGCRTWFGADGKVVIERLCLSLPYIEKPFNSKVIKSFVRELRSRKCFLCFGIPMLSIYVPYGHYEHSLYISHIHVRLCYKNTTTAILLSFRKILLRKAGTLFPLSYRLDSTTTVLLQGRLRY